MMELKLQHRIALVTALPKSGTASTMRSVRHIVSLIDIFEEEAARVGFKRDAENHLAWDGSKDEGISPEFTESDLNTIRKALEALDKGASLTVQQSEVYDLFIGGA
jgi:hypothetical protein